MMKYIKVIRMKHYIKNILIFLPLVFSGMFFKDNYFFITGIGYLCFCLVASSIYIINDIKDKENDKNHKSKCKRPIASGELSVKNAIIEVIILITLAMILIYKSELSLISMVFLMIYFIMNLGYSFGFKNLPLVDVTIIAIGFLIRIIYGASLLNIEVSNWLYLTVLTISFYLALGKRRNEIDKSEHKDTRKVLKYYNKDFLDKNMYMCLSMAIVFYSLWATDNTVVKSSNNLLVWTIPIVIIICMKYSMNIEGNSDGDPVEVILKDKVMLLLILLLAFIMFFILYC